MLYIGEPGVVDVLLKRYGADVLSSASFFCEMDISEIAAQIKMALERDRDEALFSRWLIGGYERQGIGFADFRRECLGDSPPAENAPKTAEEILGDVEKMLEKINGKGGLSGD